MLFAISASFRALFCHSAPMETHAYGFRLRANAPEGQKRFPISHFDRLGIILSEVEDPSFESYKS